VESGEGIERRPPPRYVDAEVDRWNPVKELKDRLIGFYYLEANISGIR